MEGGQSARMEKGPKTDMGRGESARLEGTSSGGVEKNLGTRLD